MKAQINLYVDSCETCQWSKGRKQPTRPHALQVATEPWKHLTYDFIVKLPKSSVYDSILVVVDRNSKMAHFIPCKESTNAEQLANLFISHVWKLHGLPASTISDRGTTFNSKFLKALYEKLQIDPRFSTAYH